MTPMQNLDLSLTRLAMSGSADLDGCKDVSGKARDAGTVYDACLSQAVQYL